MSRPYTIEPELAAAPPRRVRARDSKATIGLGCVRLFILPHMLVGAGLLLAVIGMPLFMQLHATAEGAVISKDTSYDSEDGTSYRVRYSYQVDGATYEEVDTVDRASFDAVVRGQSVPVAHIALAPGWYSAALLPGRSLVRSLGFLALMAVFWNGILSVFVVLIYWLPWRQKQLCRWGVVAAAVVVRKDTVQGESGATRRLHYEFRPLDAGAEVVRGSANVGAEEWPTISDGDMVTVLYDPRKPSRSVAYRYGLYRVAGHAVSPLVREL